MLINYYTYNRRYIWLQPTLYMAATDYIWLQQSLYGAVTDSIPEGMTDENVTWMAYFDYDLFNLYFSTSITFLDYLQKSL